MPERAQALHTGVLPRGGSPRGFFLSTVGALCQRLTDGRERLRRRAVLGADLLGSLFPSVLRSMLSFLLDPGVLASLLTIVPFLGFGLVSTSNGEEIKTVDLLEGLARFKLPQGRYESLEAVITADNKSGETVTFADVGRLRVLRNGDDQHQIFESLDYLADLHDEFSQQGSLRDTTQGGTSTLKTKVTQRLPMVAPTNALHVPGDEETTLVFDLNSSPGGSSGLNSLANSGQLKLVGFKSPAIAEQAAIRWERTQVQFSGSGEKEIENVSGENVSFIYIRDPDDVVTELTLSRLMPGNLGTEKVYDGEPIERIQRKYESQNRDFGTSGMYGVMVGASPSTSDIRNRGVDLEIKTDGASSNIEVMYARVGDPIPANSSRGPRSRASQLGM